MTGQVTEGGHILGGVPGHRADVGLAAALGRLQQGEGGEGEQAQGTLGEGGVTTSVTFPTIYPTQNFGQVYLYQLEVYPVLPQSAAGQI